MNNLNWCLNTWLIHNLNFPLIFYFLLSNDWVSLHISLLLLLLFLLFIYIFYLTFDHLPVLSCCLAKFVCPHWFGSCFFLQVLLYFSSCRKWEFFNCVYGQLAQISRYRYGIPNFAHVKKNCCLPITRTLTNSKLTLTWAKFNFPWISSIQCNFTLGNSNPR